MKKISRPFFIAGIILFSGIQSFAQDPKIETDIQKDESITIRKKGDSKQKFTIVIDSDKVTINGKPVDDFKSENIEVIKGDDNFMFPPEAPSIDYIPRMDFKGNFMREIHSNKAFLGVMTEKTEAGAKVKDVTSGSPAEKAGIKQGDIITKVNDTSISGPDDLYKTIGNYKENDKIKLSYLRNGKTNTTTATLQANKQVKVFKWHTDRDNNWNLTPPAMDDKNFNFVWSNKPRLGLQIQDTEDSKGVKVLDVDDESPAGKAGIQEDDIITQMNGKNITSVDDMRTAMKDIKQGDEIKFSVLHKGQPQNITVKIPKELKTTDL